MARTNAIFAMKINTFCVIIIFVIALCLGSNAQAPTFNVSTIPSDTRDGWCQQQTSWCANLCIDEQNTVETNDCNPDNLDYHCICSNGYKPNSTEYTLPVPYYICTTEVSLCKGDCATGNTGCVDSCNRNCSATNPSKHNITFSTGLPTPTSSSSGTSSPSASPNILGSAASSINASFIVFLAVAFSMSIRF